MVMRGCQGSPVQLRYRGVSLMSDESRQCTATSKSTGQQCKRMATPGHQVCYWHGSQSTGPKTPEGKARSSVNALKHGAFAHRILDEEERRQFDALVEQLQADLDLNRSTDLLEVEALGMAFIQLTRAMKAGNAQAAETFDRMVRGHLKRLEARKISNNEEAGERRLTPAEWATELVAQMRDRRRKRKAGKTAEATEGPQEE